MTHKIRNTVWTIAGIFLMAVFVFATTTGTGSINISSGGTLHLLNGANITTTKLNLQTTGDQVFISAKSELAIG